MRRRRSCSQAVPFVLAVVLSACGPYVSRADRIGQSLENLRGRMTFAQAVAALGPPTYEGRDQASGGLKLVVWQRVEQTVVHHSPIRPAPGSGPIAGGIYQGLVAGGGRWSEVVESRETFTMWFDHRDVMVRWYYVP